MNINFTKTAVAALAFCAFVSACGQQPNPTDAPVANAVQTAEAVVPDTMPTEAAIQHKVLPVDFPAERTNEASDYDSSSTAAKKIVTSGDRFTFGWFERPFNANTMDVYFPNLDIVDALIHQDETWTFGSILMKGTDSNNALTGKYALEFDLDRDGRGNWLIIVSNPTSTEWSVNGVQIYQDANKDIGDVTPMIADGGATGDGFETLFFDQGNGDDPDSAWVRISPNDPNTVEIAVKRSVIGSPERYLVGMWAGSSLDPAIFDINDHFTHEQAGAADLGFELFYPIKEVSEIDNTCRMAMGFEPTGEEPGGCAAVQPHTESGNAGGGKPGGGPCAAGGPNCP